MGLILIIHSYSVYAYNTTYVALKNLQGACRYWSILQLFAVEPNLDRFRHTVFASYLTESQIFCFKEDRWISVCRWATSSSLSWSRMILSTQTVAPAGSDTPMPVLFMFIYAAGLGVSANHLKPLPGVHVWIEMFFSLAEYVSLKILLITENNESIYWVSSRNHRHDARHHLWVQPKADVNVQ